MPGYIQSDGERGSRRADGAGLLSRFETLWPDTAAESAAPRRWAAEHPKRALAAAAAVGTIDQALLSGLPVRHAHLRGAVLLRALVVADEVHASDAYMTELLELTIPAENRALVEAATRFSGLASLAQALGEQWEAHWREYAGVIASRRGAADTIRLDWSEPWDAQRWPAEPGERTRTRLGLGDRLVELSETWTSPFGQVIERMKIPGWMVKCLEDHEENARITDRTSTELRFHWGGGNFVYNRHGPDFAEDAGGGPSSPVPKERRRRE